MHTSKWQRLAYGGKKEIFELTLPKEIEFCKVYEASENQQTWLFVIPNENKALIDSINCLAARKHVINNLTLITLTDVKPLSDITTIEFIVLHNKIIGSIRGTFVSSIGRDAGLWRIYKILDFDGLRFKCGIVSINVPHCPKDWRAFEVEWIEMNNLLVKQTMDFPICSSESLFIIDTDCEKVASQYENAIQELLNIAR